MASTRRKAAAVAIAIVGVAGLSLAAAAQLTVNTSQLAAGSAIVTGCDTTVDVDYTVVGDTVTEVLLSNVDPACNTADYSVQLLQGASPSQTALGTAATGASLTVASGSATVALPAAQPVASVTGIAIVLH